MAKQFKTSRYGTRSVGSTKNTITLGVGGRGEIAQTTRWFDDMQTQLLNAKRDLGGDLRPIWDEASKIILAEIDEGFETSGHSLGRPWKPLNENYARKKAEAIGDQPILVYTGAMRSSVGVERSTENSLKITAKDPKAPKHQFGDGRIPARPFMVISSETVDEIMNMISELAENSLRGVPAKPKSRNLYLKRSVNR